MTNSKVYGLSGNPTHYTETSVNNAIAIKILQQLYSTNYYTHPPQRLSKGPLPLTLDYIPATVKRFGRAHGQERE